LETSKNNPYSKAKPNKDPCSGTSFSPISLLSPIAKVLGKVILSHLTQNIPQVRHQHGFKSEHSTTTALHQLTNQITQGFNQRHCTIVVYLDLSKAFDTVNIHSLMNKLHQTMVPNTIIKFISNYIKEKILRISKTLLEVSTIQNRDTPGRSAIANTFQFIYTSDLPLPPEGVSITTYADDMTPAASHSNYNA